LLLTINLTLPPVTLLECEDPFSIRLESFLLYKTLGSDGHSFLKHSFCLG